MWTRIFLVFTLCASAFANHYLGGWDPNFCCYPVPPGCCQEPCPQCLDVMWMVDESSSISMAQFVSIKQFLLAFEAAFTYGPTDFLTRFSMTTATLTYGPNNFLSAMVQYSTGARLVWNLGANPSDATEMAAINAMVNQGGLTNVGAAIDMTLDNVVGSAGDRKDCDNICIVVTDGLAQITVPDLETKAALLHAKCDASYAVGVEILVNPGNLADFAAQLLAIAGAPERVFSVNDFTDLETAIVELLRRICEDFVPPSSDECCPYDFIYFYGPGLFIF